MARRNWGRFAEGLVTGYQSERKAATEREESRLRMEAERQRMAAITAEQKRAADERAILRQSADFDFQSPGMPGQKPVPAVPVAGAPAQANTPPASAPAVGSPAGATTGVAGIAGAGATAQARPSSGAVAASVGGAPSPAPQPAVAAQPPVDLARLQASVRAHQSQIDSIEDPGRRAAAQRNFDRQRIAAASGPVAQAMSLAAQQDMAGAAARLNHAYTLVTGFDGNFTVQDQTDDKGQPMPVIVGPDGRPIGRNFMTAITEVFGGDEVKALAAAEALRTAAEQRQFENKIAQGTLAESVRHNIASEGLTASGQAVTREGNRLAYDASIFGTRASMRNADVAAASSRYSSQMNFLGEQLRARAASGAAAGAADRDALVKLESAVGDVVNGYSVAGGLPESRVPSIRTQSMDIIRANMQAGLSPSASGAVEAATIVDAYLNIDKLSDAERQTFEDQYGKVTRNILGYTEAGYPALKLPSSGEEVVISQAMYDLIRQRVAAQQAPPSPGVRPAIAPPVQDGALSGYSPSPVTREPQALPGVSSGVWGR